MKKTIRILIPIILVLVIIASCCWYLFFYDRAFTRDMLLSIARFSEEQGYHGPATWFYSAAYAQSGDNDSVAIELAQQYKNNGNYTKAEYTLHKAILDGASVELYMALSSTFVEQGKLMDAENMLNSITNPAIKQAIEQIRPAPPTPSHTGEQYNQLISVEFTAPHGTIYVSSNGEYPSVKSDLYAKPIALKEGENILRAITVSENGLVSTSNVCRYTIGGIIRPVIFEDVAIETAVREQLMIETPTTIYTNDLWQIKEFTVPAEAQVYSDIALFTYLESLTVENAISTQLHYISKLSELQMLHITGTSVSDDVLSSFTALPKLTNLTLSDCDLSTITTLSNATGLKYLDLSSNAIRNLEPLNALTELQELYLSHNAIVDLSTIANLNSLTTLDVSYNTLADLSGVFTLANLSCLYADYNALTQLDGIGALSNLTSLSVNGNKLTSIAPIADCAKLSELNIAENKLTKIAELGKLNNLMHLNFSNNNVTNLPTWSKNCALVSINGDRNKIKSLSPLSGLKSLNIISMDYNKDISSVKDLASCPLLIQVNVYGTKVKDVSALTELSIIVNYTPV